MSQDSLAMALIQLSKRVGCYLPAPSGLVLEGGGVPGAGCVAGVCEVGPEFLGPGTAGFSGGTDGGACVTGGTLPGDDAPFNCARAAARAGATSSRTRANR